MSTDQTLTNVENLFTGLRITKESVKNIQEVYDPILAFKFNSLEFFSPKENKISEILAYFLNPKKPHGQGNTFLKLFLSEFLIEDLNFSEVTVQTEYPFIDSNGMSRRIDIVIIFDNGKFVIGIENKIWAIDQNLQVIEYMAHLEGKFNNSYAFFYLNPYKASPSELSITKEDSERLKHRLTIIDYSTQIISLLKKWILNCRADRVKTFLTDLEQFLQHKFNKETSMNEHQIIADYVLKTEERIETAFLVERSMIEIKEALVKTFTAQLNELGKKLELNMVPTKVAYNMQYGGFKFSSPLLKNSNISIGFQFQEKFYGKLIFGLIKSGVVEEDLKLSLQRELNNAFAVKGLSSEAWLWHTDFKEYKTWDDETYLAIFNEQLILNISQKVEAILKALSAAVPSAILD